jgi:CheY-like chemotaxis protein
MLLRLYAYEVELAADGLGALRTVQASSPDVVLLDIGLPHMNGWEVAKHLRKQCCCKRPFLVALTAYHSQADWLRSQEAGIGLHLVKPVDPEELEKLLRRVQSIGSGQASQTSADGPWATGGGFV